MESLIEFEAKRQENSLEVTKYAIQTLLSSAINSPYHKGECTGDEGVCKLCVLETTLHDYYKYTKKYNNIWVFKKKTDAGH